MRVGRGEAKITDERRRERERERADTLLQRVKVANDCSFCLVCVCVCVCEGLSILSKSNLEFHSVVYVRQKERLLFYFAFSRQREVAHPQAQEIAIFRPIGTIWLICMYVNRETLNSRLAIRANGVHTTRADTKSYAITIEPIFFRPLTPGVLTLVFCCDRLMHCWLLSFTPIFGVLALLVLIWGWWY